MYDLSKCYIDISALAIGEKVSDKYPEITSFSEFMECSNDMVKIAILIGDVDSPFVRIKDREVMFKAIFDYLGLDTKTHQSMLGKLVAYRHPLVMGAWLRYMQILHETDFTDWSLARKDYDFFLSQTDDVKMTKETDLAFYKRKNEARDRVRELGQEVRRIEAKLFPDSKAAREAAIIANSLKIKLWAESYAESNTYI